MAAQLGPVPATSESDPKRQNAAIQTLFSAFTPTLQSLGAATLPLPASIGGTGITNFSVPLPPSLGGTGLTDYSALTNNGTSITTSSTVSNSSKGHTLVLSGTGATALIKTLTFAAASGYDADFQVMVLNADARGWLIAPSGFTAFILWPGQSKIVYSQTNIWRWTPFFERWQPAGAAQITINVDPSAGNDTNDGLGTAGGAKQSVLSAWNMIRDFTDGHATIQLVAGGAFGAIGELDGDASAGFGRLIMINGDPTLVNPPVITVPAATIGLVLRDGAWATLDGLSFVSSGANAVAINAQQTALADLKNIEYGAFSGGVHAEATDGSIINVTDSEFIIGTATVHWLASAQSKLLVGAITVNGGGGAFNFASGFSIASGLARITTAGTIFSGCGAFTGGGYTLSRHSIFESNGITPPGGAGTADATSNFY